MKFKDTPLGHIFARGMETLLRKLTVDRGSQEEVTLSDEDIEPLKAKLYGRPEQDIQLIVQTSIDYHLGKIDRIPQSVLNLMSPTLPKEQDYTKYDQKIKKKIATIKDPYLREMAEKFLLDPDHFSNMRASRNLHHFQMLKKIASLNTKDFHHYTKELIEKNTNIIFDKFKIPLPFLPINRDDDTTKYFHYDYEPVFSLEAQEVLAALARDNAVAEKLEARAKKIKSKK